MSRRYYITLPDQFGDDLERWAEALGDKPATLAATQLQQSIRKAKENGEIPEEKDEAKTLSYRFMRSILAGNRLSEGDVAVLAYVLDTETEFIQKIMECALNGNGEKEEAVHHHE